MSTDSEMMGMAFAAAAGARHRASPNPWVGALVAAADGNHWSGATRAPGGPHAERVALGAAGDAAAGSTLFTTLEPCNHTGRTGPCTEAIIDSGVSRVVIGIEDPDPSVAGSGVTRLRDAGLDVTVGVMAAEIELQLEPYLHHRRTGLPWVLLKLASSVDGRTAAPDGSSQWITGSEARSDSHRLRAESDAILVGAGTVRADDPTLTVRDWPGPGSIPADEVSDPLRVVLGSAPETARVHPCLEWTESIPELLSHLGSQGVVQLMVEGGASVARSFHDLRLVDEYVIYMAPMIFGGDDARALFAGSGAAEIGEAWRGEIRSVEKLGSDLRIEMRPTANAAEPRR